MTGRRIRVATVITRLEGGAGVVALRGASALDPESYDVTVFAGGGGRLLAEADRAGVRTRVEPALRPTIQPGADLLAVRRLTRSFLDGGFDVVHTHCAKAGAVGRVAARRAGIPRIVHTFHGFPFHHFQPALRRYTYIGIERALGRFTDVALCVGSGVAVEAVRRCLIDPDRIRTIGVAVDRQPWSDPATARRDARRRLDLPADAVVIGAVGRLTFQKAPEDFLAAVRALGREDVVGVWVGGGELAERVRAVRLPGTPVRLTGERTDVAELLAAFDVFVQPSRYEGLPRAIVEAMTAGVPVVATAVNAVGDVVVPGETGLLVPPGRPDLLGAAVQHVLSHPGAAARMAARARSQVAGRYGVADLADTLDSVYAESGH